jgi:predicted Zn finger-like uncharacterized protein
MIVQCPDCSTRYQLDPERVPRERIRVRCPKCRYVFPIDGTLAPMPDVDVAAVTPPPAPEAPPEPTPVSAPTASEPESGADPNALDLEIERPSPAVTPVGGAPAAETVEAGVAVADPPRAESSPAEAEPRSEAPAEAPAEEDPARKKARRLARALVSDILVYNRDVRDKALAEGNLVQALGVEIKKSWELYKERVTPEVANSNNDFREALNDILADGQKIF